MKKIILGICGQSGSGKDTLADYIIDRYRFIKISLADPLKRIAKATYDFSDEQLWGSSEKRNAPDLRYKRFLKDEEVGPDGEGEEYLTPRFVLQTLGTEWGRNCYSNTWVDYCIRVASKVLDGSHDYSQKDGLSRKSFLDHLIRPNRIRGVVIPDVRFRNEIAAIKVNRGLVIKLKRHGYFGKVGIANHPSEEEQKTILDSEFDYVLEVPEGIPNFHNAIEKMMRLFQT